jgi:glycosyltransferase involved in cell wall biosynthesis
MRVAFFEFATNFGGARRSTIETATRLAKHMEVTVIDAYGCCAPFAAAARSAGLALEILKPQGARIVGGAGEGFLRRAFCLGSALPDLLQLRSRLRSLLRKLRPTILIANQTKPLALASRLGICPLIGYMRGWYRPDTLVPYERCVLRRGVEHLIAVSNPTRAALLCAGVPWNRISVIPNPVDVSSLETQASFPLKSALPQTQRRIRLLLAANVLPDKGQHTAVAALGELVKTGGDAVLYLAGEVPFSAPNGYATEVKDLAQRLGVAERVVWLGRRDDLPALIRACTTVLLPTTTEGMARIILEAMALGRPVISTPVGGNTDLILHGLTGLLVEPGDVKGLSEAIRRLGDNPRDVQSMIEAAKRHVAFQHSTQLHTHRLLELFRRLQEAKS